MNFSSLSISLPSLARRGPRPPAAAAAPLDSVDLFIGADTVYTGTDTQVTGLTATGLLGLDFTADGTGAAIQKTAEGWRFSKGQYLSWSGMGTVLYPLALIVVDVTIHGAPDGNIGDLLVLDGQIDERAHLRYTSSPRVQALGGGNDAINAPVSVFGQRQTVAFFIDTEQTELTSGIQMLIDQDGTLFEDTTITARTPITLDMITLGRAADVTLHSMAVWLRPSGAALSFTALEGWTSL